MTKEEMKQKDTFYLEEYRNKKPWGLTVSIDLKNCNESKMIDAEYIKQFVKDLCELIDMKRFGRNNYRQLWNRRKSSWFFNDSIDRNLFDFCPFCECLPSYLS